MTRKTVVFITGANTGLGLETVKALLSSSRSYHILLGSRDMDRAQEAMIGLEPVVAPSTSVVEPVQIDVCDDESIRRAAGLIEAKVDCVDVLINNAGASFDGLFSTDTPSLRTIFNRAYDVNVTGAQVTTTLLAPLLLQSADARLIFITSGASSLTEASANFLPAWRPRPGPGWPKNERLGQGYKSAKTGLNMCMLTWHWILKEDGVKTFAVSPGLLATGLGGLGAERLKAMGAGDAEVGADLVRRVVEGERDEHVGRVVSRDGVQAF